MSETQTPAPSKKQNLPSKPKKKSKNPRKGALIKGMSKRLPAEILNDPAFEKGLDSIMRDYSGIYALYRRNKLYYVGLTKNLQGRINHHLDDRHARKWDGFVIFRIERVDYLKDIETLLTRIVDPPGNRAKGNVPRDANLNHVSKEIYRERELALRRIKKALK